MFSLKLILILLIITWSVNGDGECIQYPSDGLCSNYINYTVYIGGSDSIQSIESRLTTLQPLLGISSPVNQTCADSYAEWICGLAYPPCSSDTNNPILPCKSTCQQVADNCPSSAFQDNMIEIVYPQDYYPIPTNDNCNQNINSFDFGKQFRLPDTPIYNVTYQDTQCNDIQKNNHPEPKCFSPLILGPKYPNGTFQNSSFCGYGCCLPCPQIYTLYPSGTLEKGFLATQILRVFSTLTSLIMLLSYIILPGKQSNASVLIMYTSLAIFLYSSNVLFSLGEPKRIQCANSIDQSTQENNSLCGVQGAWLVFAGHATTIWLAAIILNLHTHTVWNSKIIFTNNPYIHLICWGIPAIITIISVSLKSIGYQFGTLCFIDIKHVDYLFFYPMSVWILPSVIIHLATFVHIARIATQSETKSGESNDITDHRNHVIQAFRIQWRALLLAIILLVTLLLYWLFYAQVLKRVFDIASTYGSLKDWIKCIGLGLGQNFCSRYSEAILPRFPLLLSAEVLVSFIGIWLLVIFTNRNLWEEWRHWLRTRFNLRKLEMPDQFFSI